MVKLVGILNLTPDSFSDGGKFNNPQAAINHLNQLINEGADIIDIGAESTRPNAIPITQEEEWTRLENILPEIVAIAKKRGVQTSIDSYHFQTIKNAHEIGVDIINDVSALVDEKIVDFIARSQIPTILMHNLAIHANAEIIVNQNLNINREIINWAQNKITSLAKMGVKKSQLIFDPGIGFAKDAKQSISILKNIDSYRILEMPIYIGHSKKRFLDALDIAGDRVQKTLEVSKYLIAKKVDFLRIHDVKQHFNLMRPL
jgi:dihydropteroate synthase